MRTSRVTRTFLALAFAIAVVPMSGAASVSTAVASSPSAGTPSSTSPWTDAAYQPTPGRWQDYVLAPASRTVLPTSVLSADARKGSLLGAPAEALRADGKGVRLKSIGDRTGSPLLTLDFGKELSGKPELTILGASSPRPGLHVCMSESIPYLAKTADQNDGEAAHAPGCDTANIWNGFPGTPYAYDSDSHTLPLASATLAGKVKDPQLRGFRYLTVFLDGPGYIDLDAVNVQFTAAPGQANLRNYPGHFLSSDDQLNKIWYAGAYTVQLNTDAANTAKSWPYTAGEADHADAVVPHADPAKDLIYDGAKRDRIVWQGDLAVQAPVTYLSTGDVSAVDNSLSSLAAQQLPDGFMPAESQVGAHNSDELRTYGEYVTWFINNMSVHYLYTGDKAYLDRWYPAVTKAMAWLESVRAQDAQGLIGFGAVGSCGHYGYGDCGHETYVNALYVRNLRQTADLARVEGQPGAATTYAARADEVAKNVNDQLWDDSVGAYRLSREITNAYPQDANATTALTGVADATRSTRALHYLKAASWGDLGALTVAPNTPNAAITPFYAPMPSNFEVEARLEATDPTQVQQSSGIDLMKSFWGWMLDQDPGSTFWEHVQPDGKPNLKQFSSLAHGWAAGPTATLTNQVLGATPTGPGFSSYDVRPHPDALTWAQGAVPTPHGTLDVSWRHPKSGSFDMDVTSPAGTSGRLAVPSFGNKVRVVLDGKDVWGGTTGTARLDGGYVVIDGVGAGFHQIHSERIGSQVAAANLSVSPDSQSAEPDSIQHLSVTVSGIADGQLTGELTATGPAGWVVSPASVPVALESDGRPVSKRYDVYVYVPSSATSASYPVRLAFRGSGVTATAEASIHLAKQVTLYDFEQGTDGWTAGQNVATAAKVANFANGPGRPFTGQGALEAATTPSSGSALKSVSVTPATPLDLAAAKDLVLHLDSYGGAPGATGYEAVITLTGADGQLLTKTVPFSPDSWNSLSLDVSGWASRSRVTKIEAGFRALGTTELWQARFQLDDVGWTG